jgi:hypothetical protein
MPLIGCVTITDEQNSEIGNENNGPWENGWMIGLKQRWTTQIITGGVWTAL